MLDFHIFSHFLLLAHFVWVKNIGQSHCVWTVCVSVQFCLLPKSALTRYSISSWFGHKVHFPSMAADSLKCVSEHKSTISKKKIWNSIQQLLRFLTCFGLKMCLYWCFFHFLLLMEYCFKLYLPLSVFFRCLVTGRLMVSPHGLCCWQLGSVR